MRNCQTDVFRRLEINDQLKLRGLFDREIGGLGAFQDSVHVDGYAPVAVREVRPVLHEPTGIYRFSAAVH